MKGGSSSRLYWILSLIILLSFLHFSFYFSPLLNSDSALGILMGTYLELPHDLYCWGQDRGGNFTPIISRLLTGLTGLPIIITISLVHYTVLILGAFSFAFFIRNTTLKITFFLLWFLPPWQFVEFLLYPYGLQYSILGILVYLLFHQPQSPKNNRIIRISIIGLIALIGLWISDFLVISIVALFITTFYLRRELFWQSKNIIPFLIWSIFTAGFIIYGKLQAIPSQSYSTVGANTFSGIISAVGIVWQSIKRIFLFQSESTMQSIFWWLVIVLLLGKVNKIKQIPLTQSSEKKQFLIIFFLLNTLLTVLALFCSRWVLDNEMGRRYFSTFYISLVLLMIYLLDQKIAFGKYSHLTFLIVGLISSLSAVENFYFPRIQKSKTAYIEEVTTLAPAGLIGNYWNSYVYSSIDPLHLISTPHDRSVYRNIAIVEKVFRQPNIYLVKDMWLQNFPDTVSQFGRILIKNGEIFHLGDSDFCRYQLDSQYNHFSYRPMIPSKIIIEQKVLGEAIMDITQFRFNGYSSYDSLSQLQQVIRLAEFNDATHTAVARINILLKEGQKSITLNLRLESDLSPNTNDHLECRILQSDGNVNVQAIPLAQLSSKSYRKIPVELVQGGDKVFILEISGSEPVVLLDQIIIGE